MPPPPTFDARLLEASQLSPSVRSLVFSRSDGAPMAFDAGQWVTLLLPVAPDQPLRRSYSIASAPGARRFEIAVTRVEGGLGSPLLHELPIGATLSAQGPQGFFTRGKGAGKPALFVGTGTGVTPLRSMLHDALARGDGQPLRLLFGVRRPEDLLYKSEFEELAARHPNFRVEVTLSQPGETWTGRRGYVQHHVEELFRGLQEREPGTGEPHVYICGLNRMVASVRDLLRKELGATREQVHSERYD